MMALPSSDGTAIDDWYCRSLHLNGADIPSIWSEGSQVLVIVLIGCCSALLLLPEPSCSALLPEPSCSALLLLLLQPEPI